MLDAPSTGPLEPLPPDFLQDGAIELRLLRILGPDHAAERPAAERFLSAVPEYRFAIHRRSDGRRVGRIHFRRTNDAHIVQMIGHSGYAIDEKHRRNGYASRAVRLILGLGKAWGIGPLWIIIEPDNAASRRAVERAGFVLVDIGDSAAEIIALGTGPKVCRYRCAG